MSINIGIIGCGRIFEKHIEAISSLNNKIKIIAVCDINKERAESASERLKVPYYLDYNKMLPAEDKIDMVSILTPSGYHCEHIKSISKYRENIIVEKPTVLSLPQSRDIEFLIKKGGINLFTIMQNRFNPPVRIAYDAISKGLLGKLVCASLNVYWKRDQSYYDMDDWRGTWYLDGGVLSQQGIHFIDMLQWLFGSVKGIFAKIRTSILNIEVEDTGSVILEFESGTIVNMQLTVATRPKMLGSSFTIIGEKGLIKIGGIALNNLEECILENNKAEKEFLDRYSANVNSVYGEGHYSNLEAIYNRVKGGKVSSFLVENLEGLKSVEMLNNIYRSAELGQEVITNDFLRKYKLGCPT